MQRYTHGTKATELTTWHVKKNRNQSLYLKPWFMDVTVMVGMKIQSTVSQRPKIGPFLWISFPNKEGMWNEFPKEENKSAHDRVFKKHQASTIREEEASRTQNCVPKPTELMQRRPHTKTSKLSLSQIYQYMMSYLNPSENRPKT